MFISRFDPSSYTFNPLSTTDREGSQVELRRQECGGACCAISLSYKPSTQQISVARAISGGKWRAHEPAELYGRGRAAARRSSSPSSSTKTYVTEGACFRTREVRETTYDLRSENWHRRANVGTRLSGAPSTWAACALPRDTSPEPARASPSLISPRTKYAQSPGLWALERRCQHRLDNGKALQCSPGGA